MFRSSRNRLDLAIVFAVAVIANFAYLVLSNRDFYYPDSFTYLAPARNLLRGLGFLDQNQAIETIRTPGYPLLLLLFGAHTLPVIIFQHLLNVALAIGIYLQVIWRGSRFSAWIASLIFALDVPTIHYANKVLTETPFTVLLYVVFVLALQKPRPLLIGVLTGVMVLLRPIAVLFFVAMALFYLLQRVPVRQIAVYVAVSLVLPIAWAARNYAQTGVFTISSIGGINLMNCRAGGAIAIEEDPDDFRAAMLEEGAALMDEADDAIQQQLHIPDAQELPQPVRVKYYTRYAFHVIRQHPIGMMELTVRGALVNVFDSDWDALAEVTTVPRDLVRLTIDAWAILVFALATIGVISLWRTDRSMALLIVIIVAYFVGISAGGEAESRFRVPVIPQIAIAAAVGVEAIRRGVRASFSSNSYSS